MSTFKVERTRISKIYQHSNADKLELAQVDGMTFQFCIRKDEFKVGDEVVYFPVDSMMPEALSAHFGIGGMLAGGKRVKTVKLRGAISQGFVASLASVQQYMANRIVDGNGFIGFDGGATDYTDTLGVTKYEPPVIMNSNATLTPLDIGIYDIEGCDRNPEIFEMFMDAVVVVQEKAEGMNMFASIDGEGNMKVAQRGFYIGDLDPLNPHSFTKVAMATIFPKLKEIQAKHFKGRSLRLRGEFVGPGSQGNYYGLKDQKILAFEMEVDGVPMDAWDFEQIVKGYDIEAVPKIYDGVLRKFLAGKTVQEASNGKSLINPDKLREGIVIRMARERAHVPKFGRLIIKQRSPEYLAKTGN